MPELHTVIGDLVGSRRAPDRAAAQRAVGDALAWVNDRLEPVQPFEPTVGDEFQGAFADIGSAVVASLLVRLRLQPGHDVRCGLGVGDVTVHDAGRRPLLQDGPGWWAARDALDELARRPIARTWYVGPGQGQVNAFLLTRDALAERLNDRGRRLLAGALVGLTQRQLAEQERITPSAVSQQFARGVGALREAHRAFGEPDPSGGAR